MSELGTIRGQMVLDIKQALASYTKVRKEHVGTVTALQTGGGAISSVSLGILGAATLMAGGFVYATTKAGEFERKLDFFSAVSNATQAEYEAISEKALQLGADTIFSADQIAESFVELGKSGVDARGIIDGIGEAVANLGAAADIPLDTASNILMSAVQTFGLGADQAVGVADKLAGAANASIIEVGDLGVSFKYVGGVASALGMDFDDVNTALALLGKYGIKGSTAGTSLRQTLTSLTGSTKKAQTTLKDLGIITEDGSNKFFNADGSAKSLSEVFQILQEATAGLTDEQRINAMKSIFQTRALSTVTALTKEGAAGFEEMAEAIGSTTAMEVANKRLDNLSGDIEILRGNIDTMVISSGSSFQSFARSIVQAITSAIQAFTSLPEGVQKGILYFGLFVTAAMLIIGSLGLFAGSVLQLIGLIMRIGPALSALKTGLAAVKVAMIGVNLAFLANPITWIIIGIVALIAAFIWLWNNVEGFRNFWIAVWEVIKSAALAVWNWILGLPAWFAGVWEAIKAGVTAAWEAIILFFATLPARIGAFFTGLWNWLVTFWTNLGIAIGTAVTTLITSIVTFFSELPGKIVAFFAALPGMIGYWIGFILGTLVRWAIDVATALIAWATSTYDIVVDWFAKLPGRVVEFFTGIYNAVSTWLTNAAVQAVILIIQLYNGIVNWIQQLPGRVVAFFTMVYNNITSWLSRAVTQAISLAINLYNGIVNWIQQLPGKVLSFFVTTYNNIVNKMNEAKARAIEIATGIYNGIRDKITGLPDLARGIFDRVVGAIKGAITGAFNAVRDFAAGLWAGFKDGLGIHSPSYIEYAMWAITDTIDEETRRMRGQVKAVQNLGNGISEVGTNVGFGFTEGLNDDIKSLASNVRAVQGYQDQLAAMTGAYTIAADPALVERGSLMASLQNKEATTPPTQPPPVNQNITIPMPPDVAESASRFFDWINQLGLEAHQFGNDPVGSGV